MDEAPPPLSRLESAAVRRRRQGRNVALLIVLAGLAVLLYVISIVKLGGS